MPGQPNVELRFYVLLTWYRLLLWRRLATWLQERDAVQGRKQQRRLKVALLSTQVFVVFEKLPLLLFQVSYLLLQQLGLLPSDDAETLLNSSFQKMQFFSRASS